ncbi:aminotransferase class III-fold pyridoxal phosphate-dependent enzyme [Urechidicola sp. KH5]
MGNYKNIKISLQEASEILEKLYQISGEISELPGELDFNFKVKVSKTESYVLKISRPDSDLNALDFQSSLLTSIQDTTEIITPQIIENTKQESISIYTDKSGCRRYVRLLSWIDGRIYVDVNPQTDDLRLQLGTYCGNLTNSLQHFKHQNANYKFDWDIAQSLWTKKHIQLFNQEEQEIIIYFQNQFEKQLKSYNLLRKQVVHNDTNYDNIVVSMDLIQPKIKSVIDFGDAIYTQTINDLAIVCAYAIVNLEDPLSASVSIIKGYHSKFNLQEKELEHLYTCIGMRLIISVTKAAINKQKEPDNIYLQRSDASAWELLLKWKNISSELALYHFRAACNYNPHPNQSLFEKWSSQHNFVLSDLFPTINKNEIHLLDLSVSSTWIGHQTEFNNLDYFQFKINELQKSVPQKIIAGGYLEPRPIYTSTEYDTIGNKGSQSRTIHLGIDFWLPHHTPVHALFDGEIVIATNDAGNKEYGGLIVLKHQLENFSFFTLYGHLTVDSALQYKVGDKISKGTQIAILGNYPENGNWAPHLHFQIMLSLLDFTNDFPGVAYHSQIDIWKSLCPNPNLLFNLPEFNELNKTNSKEILDFRKKHLGKSLSLQYNNPIHMVRGQGVYLIDENGKKYIDTVNNVAHVGHEHPYVVKAGQNQMAVLNTNTRYLHNEINQLAKEIIETLPPELSVVHFVNSGSEANELALRMVKTVTGSKEIIASQVGYHGNTNACIDISSYKFDAKGGNGCPDHTHIFPLPDSYRGKYIGEKASVLYANEVRNCVAQIKRLNRVVGGLILEPIISCGGQIPLPKGFLKEAYQVVRDAGGVCISDEVQVGCGRVGKSFWGFQLYDVIPDIITIGKPLGNGHPLAAVVCTKEIAEAFANGMEYFNTFGGNPVSCAIGSAVLQTVKNENLQQNALEVGTYLKQELKQLATEFPIIGDVRGEGLFLGIELVDSDKNPLANQTSYLVNRMKEFGVLMSTDGPDHNVIKIKPPLVFNIKNADYLLTYLKKVLQEDFMQSINTL